MKTPLLLVILLFAAIIINAQNPVCQWANGFRSAVIGAGPGMVTDAGGNAYVTGYFNDSMLIFGTDTLINFGSNGDENMFLAKFDSSGNALWAKSANGAVNNGGYNNAGYGVGTDANGNVYVLGSFQNPALIFGNDTLVSNNVNTFLVKYNPQGNALWAVNMGGTLNNADDIVVDANGNSYITGYFTSGSIIGGTDTIPLAGYIEAFVIKYDSSGNSVWAAGISGDNNVLNYGVAIDTATNVYVTGGYSGDSAVAGNIVLTNTGVAALYTVKYDATGHVAWARNVSVSGNIYPTAISTDGSSNIYITGNTTSDTLVFGADTAITFTSSALSNIFVARYDTGGNIKWVRCTQNINNVSSSGISAGAGGDIYLTGSFDNTAVQIGSNTLTNNDTINQFQALYVAGYDLSGNAVWATGGLTAEDDVDGGVTVEADNKGHLYVAGSYAGPGVVLDNNALPFTGTIGTESNIFVARYSVTQTNAGIAQPGNINTFTVYPNPSTGRFYFKGINAGSTLEVYDMVGQHIYSTIATGDNYTLDISAEAKGIYFYRVVDSNAAVQEGKMVVE